MKAKGKQRGKENVAMSGWVTQELGSLATVSAGNSAPQDKSLFQDGQHPFVRTADVGRVRFGIIDATSDYLNDAGIAKLRRFPRGTILFPKSGASTYLNHRVMMGFDGYVAGHLATIQAVREKINPKFLLYFLRTVDARDLVQDQSYPSLNLPLIKSIPIPLPSVSEQKRIVKILDKAFTAIETAIANTERNIANAQELSESVFDRAVHDPEAGWTETTLGNLCEFRRGLTYKKSDEVSASSNAVLRANNITIETGEINYDEERFIRSEIEIPESKKIVPGCLLVCTASGSKKHLGKVGLVEDDSGHAFGGFMGLLVPSERASAKYLFYLTRSADYRNFIDDLADGVNINNLKWAQLSRFPISLPPISEQKRITVFLDKLSTKNQSLIGIYKAKAVTLAEFKRAILRKAFAGELVTNAGRGSA